LLIDFHDVACNISQKGEFIVRLQLSADEDIAAMARMSGIENLWTGTLKSNKVSFGVQLMSRKELDKAIVVLRNGSDEEKAEELTIIARLKYLGPIRTRRLSDR